MRHVSEQSRSERESSLSVVGAPFAARLLLR